MYRNTYRNMYRSMYRSMYHHMYHRMYHSMYHSMYRSMYHMYRSMYHSMYHNMYSSMYRDYLLYTFFWFIIIMVNLSEAPPSCQCAPAGLVSWFSLMSIMMPTPCVHPEP